MEKAFLIDALGILLSLPNLMAAERALVEQLIEAAKEDIYFDTIARFNTNPFGRVIMFNIMNKGRAAGLTPHLEKLKEAHDEHHVEDGQGNPSSPVSAAPAVLAQA